MFSAKIETHYAITAAPVDKSLPAENRAMEYTKKLFYQLNNVLFDAENALKRKRKIKQSEITPEVKKLLAEIETVSNKAEKDLAKIRANLNEFVNKYSHLLQIPF